MDSFRRVKVDIPTGARGCVLEEIFSPDPAMALNGMSLKGKSKVLLILVIYHTRGSKKYFSLLNENDPGQK